MRIATVLLRWYKSFNVNYMGYEDRRPGVAARPWNLLGRDTDDENDYPFIEIPLEVDITTVVGANESGKSHLLSAISKVLTGKGIPDGFGPGRVFSRTDLCHYMSQRSKNAEDWPNIGLQFSNLTRSDLEAIGKAVKNDGIAKTNPSPTLLLTLVLAPDNNGTEAYLFYGSAKSALDKSQLAAVRNCLPAVDFIKSDLAISDQVPISTLIGAYGNGLAEQDGPLTAFDFTAAQMIAEFISALKLNQENPAIAPDMLKQLATKASELERAKLASSGAELEVQLFRDVLGISRETLQFVQQLPIADRTHADGLTSKWNREIDEKLNLAHYWQQDDSFTLRVNYKQGLLYFEITDKTGATYTFRERSSGLRYFLSYYIQAKALEYISRSRGAIVLMDEPDSFLSILGQRNLLAVFESLVKAESSGQRCQLVYTTHSPFLVNRNFPQRLRLVKKGDAEEGTQLISQAMLRRYEPVRSALGIDCSQTLFMGATNLVVEGPTDQFILCELIRYFAKPDNISELLDLNSIVVVSAESAPSVEKLLLASQWGDEPIPATVVLVDSDEAGTNIKKRITGTLHNARCKKLIEEEFTLQIGDVLKGSEEHRVVTTEDIVPLGIFRRAVERFLEKWHPDLATEKRTGVLEGLKASDFCSAGAAAGTKRLFIDHVHGVQREYDKYGVLQEIVAIVEEQTAETEDIKMLKNRLFTVCQEVRRAISASQQAARRQSGKQSVQRLIDEFFISHKKSSSVFDVQLLLERIQRDVQMLGEDGEVLEASLKKMLSELVKCRSSGHHRLEESKWEIWSRAIECIRKNPLAFRVRIDGGKPIILEAQAESSEPEPAKPLLASASENKLTGDGKPTVVEAAKP